MVSIPPLPSDRSFGLTFAVVFATVGAYLFWKGSTYGPWFIGAAGAFLVTALAIPRILRPLNRAWMRFGALLNCIVSPIVLGVIYFIVIAPVALVMRMRGRDALNRRFDPDAASYWIRREPAGPDARTSFPRQY